MVLSWVCYGLILSNNISEIHNYWSEMLNGKNAMTDRFISCKLSADKRFFILTLQPGFLACSQRTSFKSDYLYSVCIFCNGDLGCCGESCYEWN